MPETPLLLESLLAQVPDGSALKSETSAPDQGGETGGGDDGAAASPFSGLPMLLVIGVVFWFLLIAPERKRRKKHEGLLAQLKKGDEVITTAGLYGEVVQIQDQVVTLKVADGVRMRFSLQAVQGLAPQAGADEKK